MKNLLLLCLILIGGEMTFAQQKDGAAPAARSGGASCSVREADGAARQMIAAWKDGYNGGDADKVAALYAEDAFYLTQHFATGIVHGRANIKAYVKRGIDAGYHLDSLQIISVDCSGDMFYTITRYDATNAGQKVFGVNLVVAKRDAGNWRIVAHEAAVPDPATAVQRLDASGPH